MGYYTLQIIKKKFQIEQVLGQLRVFRISSLMSGVRWGDFHYTHTGFAGLHWASIPLCIMSHEGFRHFVGDPHTVETYFLGLEFLSWNSDSVII